MACAECEHLAVRGPKSSALLCTVLQRLRALWTRAYRLKRPSLLTGAGLYAGCCLVREVGLEPTRHCCRQDLNLVRLPISPLTRVCAASLKRVREGGETCNPCLTASVPRPRCTTSRTALCNLGKANFPATQVRASRQARHSNRIDGRCLHVQYPHGGTREACRRNRT
jgi:hypothetical protein